MTADEILQAAERRIVEIDALYITLAAERERLRAMVSMAGRTTPSVLPMVPTQPLVPYDWHWPNPLPEIRPYTPFVPKDDYRFTLPIIDGATAVMLEIEGGGGVRMDAVGGTFQVRGNSTIRIKQSGEEHTPY